MKTWFNIQAKKVNDEDVVDIDIFAEIGYWGVTAKSFIDELKAKKGDAKIINLSINSPGGSVFDGWAIYNALAAEKAKGVKVNTKVMGIAASMASVIAMVGDKREMPANTQMMVHNALTGIYGDAEDIRAVAGVLDKIDNSIVAVYVAKSGQDEKKVRDLMAADTFMTASEALDLGFATDVTDEIDAVACFALDNLPDSARAVFQASAKKQAPSDKTFADQVAALAKEAGLDEFSAHLALAHSKIEDVKAAIETAREIKALCNLAKQPSAAAAFIREAKNIADVRKSLVAALAKNDEDTHTDTTAKSGQNNSGVIVINTADVYAKRRKQLGGA